MVENVRIVSMFALMDAYSEKFSWEGEVHLEGANDLELCEDIFRKFNRVSDEDVRRLSELNYILPSVSVGDIIGWRDNDMYVLFRIDSLGFTQIFPGLPTG